MAPFKRVRTYTNNKKKPGSESALDNLLATNLTKRLEISINSAETSREISKESTFDRLLKGKVYNNVVYRKFPENNANINYDSVTSICTDTLNENKLKTLEGSISDLSPVVTLEKTSPCTQKNRKSEAPKNHKSEEDTYLVASNDSINISQPRRTETQEAHNDAELQHTDINFSESINSQKMILMESLQLQKTCNDSTYLSFKNSVDMISTPQTASHIYFLRKPRKTNNIKRNLQNLSDKEVETCSLQTNERVQSQIEELSISTNEIIQRNRSNLRDSHDDTERQGTHQNESVEVGEYIEPPQTSSTPLHVKNFRIQDQSPENLFSESLKIIKEWSNRCPTPNSFNSRSQNSYECREISRKSINIRKRKRDTKLLKQSRVILKRNSHLEGIIRDAFKNSISAGLKLHNVKNISNNITVRKRRSPKKIPTSYKNCTVYLTPMKINEPKASLKSSNKFEKSSSPQIIELSSSECILDSDREMSPEAESLQLSKPGIILESEKKVKEKAGMKDSSSIEEENVNTSSGFKHSCYEGCQHLKKKLKVILEKCDFTNYLFPKEYSDPDRSSLSDLKSSCQFENKFKGFSMASCSDSINLENSIIQIRDNYLNDGHDMQHKPKVNYSLTKDNRLKKIETDSNQFKMKDCYVILERMTINNENAKDNKRATLEKEPNKELRNCWVVLNENKEDKESSSPISMNNKHEQLSKISVPQPKSTTNLCHYNSLPNTQTEENDLFEGTPVKIREFVSLAPGKKFRRSIAVFKKNLELNDSGKSHSKTYRRQSVKLISVVSNKSELSQLIATNNSGYVSLQQSFGRSSLDEVENRLSNVQPVENYLNYITKNSADELTAKDIVLKRCGQTEPLRFEECYPKSALQHCQKIGEGVFGEVFLMRSKDGSPTVMKIIPIEGEQIVNLEKQKTFAEIVSEIIISIELSNLEKTKRNNTQAFVKVKRIRCVQGCYPDRLLELWELYDENKQSENDSPEMFLEDQLFIVIELANAGKDLEAFEFNNAQQALAVFEQVTCALAVAESELQFEHRDLHWGNVLITLTEETNSVFVLDGKEIKVNNRGVKATIIDFTLSRVQHQGVIIFSDLAMDEDLFTARGDYQFDIYRKMQENNGNQWQNFKPFSNILWLHYILDKALKGFRYKNTKSKQHRTGVLTLRAYEQKILEYDSATKFVQNNFNSAVFIE